MRFRVRVVIAAGLVLAGVVALLATLVPKDPAAASTAPPGPDLASFIPATDQITSERLLHLTPSGPAQVVVAFESAQPTPQGNTPRDLMILSWDRFAKRWVTVWDGAKIEAPQSGAATGGLAQNAVFPSAAYISNLTYRPIHPVKGRTDLEFEDDYSFGANGSVEVGIVHYDGQAASLAYFDTLVPGDAQPKVIGKVPHQELSVPVGWLTVADPECCPVRTYVNTVALRKQSSPGGDHTLSYIVTASTQSWLGVYALLPDQANGTWPNPVVMTVITGGPAAEILRTGDQLVGVAGVSVTSSADNGAPFMDEVAKEPPGAKIALNIIRDETPMVVNITLGSTAEAAYGSSPGAPSPGYLGVDVTSLTSVLQSQYNFAPSAGAVVLSVEANSPAASAGLVRGDVITSFGSTPITSEETLQNAAQLTASFSTVEIGYTDTSGSSHSARVTLGAFPQDSPGPQVTAI